MRIARSTFSPALTCRSKMLCHTPKRCDAAPASPAPRRSRPCGMLVSEDVRVSQRIEDYAVVGDTHTAALISREGSVDWLCLPRFDSGACFAALLGTEDHGRWLIAPSGEIRRTTRRYRKDTLVLETEHETPEGIVRVIDCMPPRRHEADLFRIVEGV